MRYIITNISQDEDGIVYAGTPTFFDTEDDAIDSARRQLAEDFGIDQDDIDNEAQEGGTPYVLSMSRDGRFEAYTVSALESEYPDNIYYTRGNIHEYREFDFILIQKRRKNENTDHMCRMQIYTLPKSR